VTPGDGVNAPLIPKRRDRSLTGTDERGRSQPVLTAPMRARQAVALTLQDTWQWQMREHPEDQTHELLAPDAAMAGRWCARRRGSTRDPGRVEPGEPVTVEATVVDKT
jgi:hypothetical protein